MGRSLWLRRDFIVERWQEINEEILISTLGLPFCGVGFGGLGWTASRAWLERTNGASSAEHDWMR